MEKIKSFETWRPVVALGSIVAGGLLVTALSYTLPDKWAEILLDRSSEYYPFTVQNLMWIVFCLGLGELGIRRATQQAEMRQLRLQYLPEDPRIVLQAGDLGEIYKNLRNSPYLHRCFLPRLIDRCILQFRASMSSDQSASLLNTSVEMFLHEVDLRYNMLRYICWVIPALGFIGTVIGISDALEFAGREGSSEDLNLLTIVTGKLAVAFNTTFLALVMAAILVLLQNLIQSREEHALNLAGQYCLDNLINRLYVVKDSEPTL